MNKRDVIKHTVLSMVITGVILGGFVASVPVDLGTKVSAVLMCAGITGVISAVLCSAYMLLRRR